MTTKTKTTGRRRKGEGSVSYVAKQKRYVAQITRDGKRHTVSAKTERECVDKLDALRGELKRGAVITARVGLTVADVLEHWLNKSLPNEVARSGKGDAPGTRIAQAGFVRRLVAHIGDRPIAKLTVADIEQAYEAIATGEGAKGRATSNDYLQRMQIVLRRAVKDGMRRGVVSDSVLVVVNNAQLPFALTTDTREGDNRRALTADEMRALLAAAKGRRLHALFVLALSSGMRPGELTGLYWEDLHLDAKVPYVEVTRSVRLQKNQRYAVEATLKTKGAERDLELSPTVVAALRSHRVAQNAERLAAGPGWWQDENLVFATTRGTVLNPSNVRREFATVCKLAGVARIVPYECRHTFATLLGESKMNTFAIVDILGHADDRMFTRRYRKKRKEMVRGSTAVIDQFLKAKRGDNELT